MKGHFYMQQGLGALVLSTQQQAGAAGWMAVVINTPPNGTITAGMLAGVGGMQVWETSAIGQTESDVIGTFTGTAAPFDLNWLTSGQSFTFQLIPVDASGNTYAAVEQLNVVGQPGIYLSPSVPAAVIAQLKAANPTLQVYGSGPVGSTAPAPAASIGDFLSNLTPTEMGIGAAGLALVLYLLTKR